MTGVRAWTTSMNIFLFERAELSGVYLSGLSGYAGVSFRWFFVSRLARRSFALETASRIFLGSLAKTMYKIRAASARVPSGGKASLFGSATHCARAK